MAMHRVAATLRLTGVLVVGGCIFFLLLNSCASSAETSAAARTRADSLVSAQRYTFLATAATPQRGRTLQLTSTYSLKVSRDTIAADLPYFGRAYSAPIGRSSGGIDFVSTDFDYTITNRKKKGWRVVIKPNDVPDVRELSLAIGADGYGSLQVISTFRQPISFSGRLEQKTDSDKL